MTRLRSSRLARRLLGTAATPAVIAMLGLSACGGSNTGDNDVDDVGSYEDVDTNEYDGIIEGTPGTLSNGELAGGNLPALPASDQGEYYCDGTQLRIYYPSDGMDTPVNDPFNQCGESETSDEYPAYNPDNNDILDPYDQFRADDFYDPYSD
jgi:hypothetical protein